MLRQCHPWSTSGLKPMTHHARRVADDGEGGRKERRMLGEEERGQARPAGAENRETRLWPTRLLQIDKSAERSERNSAWMTRQTEPSGRAEPPSQFSRKRGAVMVAMGAIHGSTRRPGCEHRPGRVNVLGHPRRQRTDASRRDRLCCGSKLWPSVGRPRKFASGHEECTASN